MTSEENSKLITQMIESMGIIVEQEGKHIKLIEKVTDTLLDMTERVIHLERMIGIRK